MQFTFLRSVVSPFNGATAEENVAAMEMVSAASSITFLREYDVKKQLLVSSYWEFTPYTRSVEP